MAYGVAALFFSGLFAMFYALGLFYGKIERLKLLTISASCYFTVFVIVSGLYFWADSFQWIPVLLTVLACPAAFIAWRGFRRETLVFSMEGRRRSVWLYVVILLGLLISVSKFTFYGMGQDEGVYQTEAIALASGHTKHQLGYEEADNLPEDQRGEAFRAVTGLMGYDYFDKSYPVWRNQEKVSYISGVFHGIPTFPAMLALFLQIFGLSNMQQINTVFYLCAAFFLLLITENLALKKSAQILALSVFTMSPIMQWVMKSALTEGFLCMLCVGILYGMTEPDRRFEWLSVLHICGFAFLHLTIFTMEPLFAALFIFLYLETKEKRHLWMGATSAVLCALGVTMMHAVQPWYTCNNLMFSLPALEKLGGRDAVLPFLLSISLVCFLACVCAGRFNCDKAYQFLKREKIFALIVRIIILTTFIVSLLYARRRALPLQSLSLSSYILGTGIFALCLTLLKVFIRPQTILENKDSLIVAATFFYCVLLMSAFVRRAISYYYYYSRYCAPYIVVCALFVAVFLNSLSRRTLIALAVCGAAALAPFNWSLATQKDDSRVTWEVLNALLSMDGENSALLVEGGRAASLFELPMKTATQFRTYPLLSDYEKEIEWLSNQHENLYLLSTANSTGLSRYGDRFMTVFLARNVSSEDKETTNVRPGFFPFPLDFTQNSYDVRLMRYERTRNQYDFTSSDFSMYGMGETQVNRYRWLTSRQAGFRACLEKGDYVMNVVLGNKIPLDKLRFEEYDVGVYVNNNYVGAIQLSSSTSASKVFSFQAPESVINEGSNIVTFVADPWSPADYGEDDAGKRVIPLAKVEFVKTDLSQEPVLTQEETTGNVVTLDFGEDENFDFSGFSANEKTFRWTNNENAVIFGIRLQSGADYLCQVNLGTRLPSYCFHDGAYDVIVTTNDDPETQTLITLHPGDKEFSFFLSDDELEDTNDIAFHSQLWSPSEHGGNDARRVGIPIDKVVFTLKEE